ncbi:MAG TPA: hemerythrin domain-containing protein [Polyangiaceae bacterium]|nr:hemerythrin domain-containing protein [Polyangiaceae bacterium]
MPSPPNLLNDDGSASMATLLMLSHHAFRRDLGRFAKALERVAGGDSSRVDALREEWKNFHAALHGHHHIEDTAMFPGMRAQNAELGRCIDGLAADHRKIDPLLEEGDRAFAQLPQAAGARSIVAELQRLLDPHLATEEAELVPHIRPAKEFPTPPDDAAAEMYAEGFAWSMQGIAPDVLEKVQALLPPILTARLPAARAAFAERCEKVWGTAAAGSARTPIPTPEV